MKSSEEIKDLIAAPKEKEWIELKSWLDLKGDKIDRANTARHIAALANFGGGYLLFGFNDDGTRCTSETDVQEKYHPDVFFGIVSKYLQPKIQCTVHFEEAEGVLHPVLWVPPHKNTPIITVKDGPQDNKGRPQGIKSGAVYIRVAGPESSPINAIQDWDKLIQRCTVSKRDELLSMFGDIISGAPALEVNEDITQRLEDWHSVSRQYFLSEAATVETAQNIPVKDNYVAYSYALEGPGVEKLTADASMEILRRSNAALRDTVYYGWSMFNLFDRDEIRPQFKTDDQIEKGAVEFLETNIVTKGRTARGDLWRVGMNGMSFIARHYMEDDMEAPSDVDASQKWYDPWLHIRDLCELVRHARAVGEELQDIQTVHFQIEQKGLKDRKIASCSPSRIAGVYDAFGGSDTRVVRHSFEFAELITNLPNAVSTLYAPYNRVFDPSYKVSPEWIKQLMPSFNRF